MTLRRVTTSHGKRDITEKQNILWDHLLERLALDLQEGALPCLMLGSDEFGQHFFPHNDYTYDFKGSKDIKKIVFLWLYLFYFIFLLNRFEGSENAWLLRQAAIYRQYSAFSSWPRCISSHLWR